MAVTATDISRADWIETTDGRIGKVVALAPESLVVLMDDTGRPERIRRDDLYRVVPAN